MKSMAPVIILVFLLVFILSSAPALAQDFAKETIYFIVVDRFHDGDKANNPPAKIYSADKSEWKLYWGGDLDGIIQKLPYIKSLGCTAIWITPVIDNTEDIYLYGKDGEEKISGYHGYWGRDYYKINRFFGGDEKMKELIEKAHEQDIKIIFDFVLNHTSPHGQGIDGAVYKDGKKIADYSHDPKKWFHHNGTIDFRKSDPKEWQDKNLFDLSDFNSENPEVEKYLFESAKKWMAMGLDSFRLDTVRHIPIDFATRFAEAMKAENPEIFIFGEWSMGGLDVKECVDFTRKTGINIIDFKFTFYITDVLCKDMPFKKLADYVDYDTKIRNPELMVTCIDNHDMPRFISTAIGNGASMKTAQKKTELATYIMQTSRGIPCLYYGTEQYLHVDKKSTWGYGGEPYNRQMMTGWDNYNEFSKNIKTLAQLRREIPAIAEGTQHNIKVTENLWAYERRLGESIALVVVNKGQKRTVKLDDLHLPDGLYDNSEYRFYKVMGPTIEVKDMKSEVTLGKNEIGIWCCRR